MHANIRKAVETYLKDGKIPTLEDIGLAGSEYARTKDPSNPKDTVAPAFVTFYKDGNVIASSGRIHATAVSTAKEALEHALLCLKDPRFSEAVRNPEDFKNVRIRIDVIPKRRMLKNVDELDVRKEGLIFLSQARNALSVLLPGMSGLAETPRQMLSIAMKKAGLDPKSVPESDYLTYGIETVVMSDF